ncbi:MAG: DUF423 domain-containing protein [Gemmatimonadales bacterium]
MRGERVGAILAAVAVAAGAFGAHALRGALSPDALASWETAARYQMYHALALILVGILAARRPTQTLRVAGWLFVSGVVLFSGSLYSLALTGQLWFGAITPLGGAAFIAGWVCLAAGNRGGSGGRDPA